MRTSALLLLLAAGAGADSWSPYGEQLAVSENGKRYLITRQLFKPRIRTTFELCERKEGADGPRVERAGWRDDKVTRGPEDRVLAGGELEDPPLDVWVLDGEPAAILFESYGHVGYDISLARLDANGKLRWMLEYSDLDLRGAEITHSVSSIWWCAGWWVDEAHDRVVLVAHGGVVNVVDLETGKLKRGDGRAILDSMRTTSAFTRWQAFRLCPEKVAPEGWKALAQAVAREERLPASARLAAALALHRAGGAAPDPALFVATVRERPEADTIVEEAAYLARRSLGANAVPVLEEVARRFERPSPFLAELGDKAIPALVRLASQTPASDGLRAGSAAALATIRTDAARGALVRVLRTTDAWLPDATLARLDELADPALDAALAESLRTPGRGDAAIAARLALHPKPEYAEPLAIALRRHERGTPEREAIAAALGKCK